MNADLYVFASAAFAPKSNIADGSISIDSSTLKGQVRKPLDILAWTASFEDCTLRPT